MKPNDLKPPFSWHQRHVLVLDHVFYVPEYYTDYAQFQFPGWSDPAIFGNAHPVHVEYCSGNGDWIAQKAAENPDVNWVAIEKQFDRVRKIWAKLKNRNLKNLLILCGEGIAATSHFLPTESVEEIYVNFPDPWPKARHEKNRLVSPPFLKQAERILKNEGGVTLVTDDVGYCEWTIKQFMHAESFLPHYPEPFFTTDLPEYGSSYFETLWRSQGKEIHYLRFNKR